MSQKITPHFRRITGVSSLIILQLLMFYIFLTIFSRYFVHFYWICLAFGFLVCIWIANQNTKIPYKIAWIIPILAFPLFGAPTYFLMNGFRYPTYKTSEHLKEYLQDKIPSKVRPEDLRFLGTHVVQQSHYINNTTFCPPCKHTETRYLPVGESFFPLLLKELSEAKKYIFLEYYIISEGLMWSKVRDTLVQKAKEGVEVRIIYDGLGSYTTLPNNFQKDLESQGISCCVFHPVMPIPSIQQNNRDHRKICIIDGIVGFTGGINIADEYINEIERFGYWKDSSVFLRGDAVWSMTVMFLKMWESLKGEDINYLSYFPKVLPLVPDNIGFVQPYFDNPSPNSTISADLHAQMFSKAKWYLYITTPYLIIDETIASVLQISARSGVDVRIMTPRIPDKKLVFNVTQSHYEALIKAGVRIYEFLPGFIHSKTVVADDLYASIGTCNLDYRSLYLQYENGAWLCGTPSVIDVRKDFLANLAHCEEITSEFCKNTSVRKRIMWSILRIFAPLM